jgi:hypothetical protein
MECSDLVVEGNSTSSQFLYVLTSGIGDVAGVQFGLEYPASVDVQSWTACTGGLSIPSPAWPDSGSALAITWDPAAEPTSTDSLVVVGYFRLGAGSSGLVSIIPDPRTGVAEHARSDGTTFAFHEDLLAVADVNSGGNGYGPCGSGEGMGGGGSVSEGLPVPLGVPLVVREPLISSSFDCGEPSGGTVRWTRIEDIDDVDGARGIATTGNPSVDPDAYSLLVVRGYLDSDATLVLQKRRESNGLPEWTVNVTAQRVGEFRPRMNLVQVVDNVVYVASETATERIYVGAFDATDGEEVWQTELHETTIDGVDRLAGFGVTDDGYVLVGGGAVGSGGPSLVAYRLDADDGALLDSTTLTGFDAEARDAMLSPTPGGPFVIAGTGIENDIEHSVVVALDPTTLDVDLNVKIAADEGFYEVPYAVRVDLNGNIVVAGEGWESENPFGDSYFFVARIHQDGLGSDFHVRIDDIAGVSPTSRAVDDLVVSESGMTFLVGTVERQIGSSEVDVYRIDSGGTVAWDAVFACEDEYVQGGAVQLREADLSTLVTYSSPDPDATGCCETSACLHAVALDAIDGDLLSSARAVSCLFSGDRPSVPRAMAQEEGDSGVYVSGSVYRGGVMFDAVVGAFDLPLRSPPVSVGEPVAAAQPASFTLSANGVRGALRVLATGDPEVPAVLELFDVMGRRLRAIALAGSTGEAEFRDLPAGVYFLNGTSGAITAHARGVVIR